MKKVIISISAALVVLTILYIVVEKSGLFFKIRESSKPQVRDFVGETVEAGYRQTTGLVALGLKRKIEIEDKKLDYLLQKIGEKDLLSKDIPAFKDYLAESPYCEKIIVVNNEGKLLFSTPGTGVPVEEISERILASRGTVITSPVSRQIIFFRRIPAKPPSTSVLTLFYYSADLFRPLFEGIDTLEYDDFVILKNNLILINFPDVDPQDETNADRLFELLSEEETGSVRVEVEGSDLTVHYTRVAEPYDNMILGLSVGTEQIGISSIGLVILISQTIVVLSLLIFVFASIGQKRGSVAGEREPAPAGEEEAEPLRAEEEGIEVEPLDEISATEAGIISLSDVEELTEVEEIGEAVVADEEDAVDAEYIPEPDEEKKPPLPSGTKKVEPEGLPEGKNAEETGKKTGSRDISSETALETGDLDRVDFIEDDLGGLDTERQLPGLGELVKGRVDRDFEGSGEQAALLGITSLQEPSVGPSVRPSVGPAVDRVVPVTLKEPDDTPLAIPDEVYQEKGAHDKDDELSHLIKEMKGDDDEAAQGSESLSLPVVFSGWLKGLGLSKGALLVEEKQKVFKVAVSDGLSDRSKAQLQFRRNEAIFRTIFSKGKLLYIKQDAFLNDGLRDKFDGKDAAKIKGLFFAPIGVPLEGGSPDVANVEVKGIIVVGMTKGVTIKPEKITKEIKKIKKTFLKYL